MRISDTDRDRAVDELRRHCAAGRIDIDDFAERLAEAMAAETLADLDHALRDLPTVRIADPAGGPVFARRDGGTGGGRGGQGGGGRPRLHLRARLVLLVSVLVVVAGATFLILAQWVWAAILVAGWLLGLVQGRLRGTRR